MVDVDVSNVYWCDDSRWWMSVVYFSVSVSVSVGDWLRVIDGDDVIVEGEVIRVSQDNVVWVKSKDFIWLEKNGCPVSAVCSEYDVSKSIKAIVDSADVSMAMSDLVMYSINDDVEVWIGKRKVLSGVTSFVDDNFNERRVTIYSYGKVLSNVYVNMVYYDEDVFNIVKDMVERVTDLEVVGELTGVVMNKFVAKDYLLTLVEELAHIVGYQIRVEGKKLIFEELGVSSASSKLDNSNCRFGKWSIDVRQLVNELYLEGGELTYHYVDEFTGDGSTKEFKLTYRPIGNINVDVDGKRLLSGVDYTIDDQKPSVIFKVAPPSSTAPNIVVSYDYGIGVVVKVKDDNSIRLYGLHDKKFKLDWICDFDTAKAVAWGIIKMFSKPYTFVQAKAVLPKIVDSDIDLGLSVECIDVVSKKDEWLIVRSIEYNNGVVKLDLGSSIVTFDEWASEVDTRLRMLEQTNLGTDELTQFSAFSESMKIVVSKSLLSVKVKKVNGGLMFGMGEIGVTEVGVKYGYWEVIQ